MGRLPEPCSFQAKVIADSSIVAHIPKTVSLVEAAGIPLVGFTFLMGLDVCDVGNKGYKRAFVPARLGCSGSYAVQPLK